jgi:hypothetical protein
MLDLSQSVDIKPHHTLCDGSTPKKCRCIPPPEKIVPSPDAEYLCKPAEPEYAPPIGTNYLTHYFHHTKCLQSQQTDVINQFPKRVLGELIISGTRTASGWGIAFEEGWNKKKIWLGLTLSTVLSGIFGIIWSVVKDDLQGGFTVASFCISGLTLIQGYLWAYES